MEQVPGAVALSKVGVERHPTEHWARAVSSEQKVYILHSRECLLEYEDLTECHFSVALAEHGIQEGEWPEDEPVLVSVVGGVLEPRE